MKVVTISSWLNSGRPAPPGKGSAAGRKSLAQPYYSQRAVFASLPERFFISYYLSSSRGSVINALNFHAGSSPAWNHQWRQEGHPAKTAPVYPWEAFSLHNEVNWHLTSSRIIFSQRFFTVLLCRSQALLTRSYRRETPKTSHSTAAGKLARRNVRLPTGDCQRTDRVGWKLIDDKFA